MYSRLFTILCVLFAFAAFALAKPTPAAAHDTCLNVILAICIDLQAKVHAIIAHIVAAKVDANADVSAYIYEIVACVNVAVKECAAAFVAGGIDLTDKVTIQAIAEVCADIVISIQACVGVIAKVAANVQACVALDAVLKVFCLALKVNVVVVVDIMATLCANIDTHVNIVLKLCLRAIGFVGQW
ncbi:hypothetical protein BKA62DRAFT_507725 [Auriculariales sp. MPI-PUGE-AT-0066]|nr:hypothetical protein BKA62DRAFT_507725 [Auriculariales sp. MPI-PUGE-AT-0066]